MKKSEKLLDAIGQIDEKWIAEAAEAGKRKAGNKKPAVIFRWQSALAACALLAVCIGLYGLLQRNGLLMGPSGNSANDEAGAAGQPEAFMEAAPQDAEGAAAPQAAARAADLPEEAAAGQMDAGENMAGREDTGENAAAAAQAESGPLTKQTEEEEKAQSEDGPAAGAQITLRVVESSSNSITCVLENKSDVPVTYGQGFYLEQQKDGNWQEVVPPTEICWEDIAFILEPGESDEVTVDLKMYYGELPAGRYRLVKTAVADRAGESGSIMLTAEFSVE